MDQRWLVRPRAMSGEWGWKFSYAVAVPTANARSEGDGTRYRRYRATRRERFWCHRAEQRPML